MRKLDLYIFLFHLISAIIWAALAYPSVTSWKDSVPWLVGMSLYANFVNHVTGATLAWIEYKKEGRDDKSA